MSYLVDTQVLVWSMTDAKRVPVDVRSLLAASENGPYYSIASIWEVAIKYSLGKADFTIDPHLLRRGLDSSGFHNLPITVDHAVAIGRLPQIHKDPFDRLLLAQAWVEGLTLLTADSLLAQYPCPVRLV